MSVKPSAEIYVRQTDQSTLYECEYCERTTKKLAEFMICSRCHTVFYCGVACQRADWVSHKTVCKEYAKDFLKIQNNFLKLINNKENAKELDRLTKQLEESYKKGVCLEQSAENLNEKELNKEELSKYSSLLLESIEKIAKEREELAKKIQALFDLASDDKKEKPSDSSEHS